MLNGRQISRTIQLTFIVDSAAFQSPFSNSQEIKINLSVIKLCRKEDPASIKHTAILIVAVLT